MNTKEATPKKKNRADKGAKHSPGAGRPVGTARPRVADPALVARMATVDSWLNNASEVVKASGIATAAGMPKTDLLKMRVGSKALTEAEVSNIEAATFAFLKASAAAFGYELTKNN